MCFIIVFIGNSEFPNVRKHGDGNLVDKSWQEQQEDGSVPVAYNLLMNGNAGSGQDNDYDMLYGPMSAEALGNSQNLLMDTENDKRNKREQTQHIHGLQRLTSLGKCKELPQSMHCSFNKRIQNRYFGCIASTYV